MTEKKRAGRKSKGAEALSHTIAFKVTEEHYNKLHDAYIAEKSKHVGVKYDFADYLRFHFS